MSKETELLLKRIANMQKVREAAIKIGKEIKDAKKSKRANN